ncbi:MAG: TonB family protein [Bacteroidales bacterium]|jgi:protein TonB|nr:TonB family protein [Bacteroidales bacterium]MDD3910687.1 TonB family protein [Bacteroidales bacterium]MDD4420081.1 TonB family protein [Bacteroidales bacterium]
MEIKKTPKADLENKKLLFREIGLMISLAAVLVAFEWSSKDKESSTIQAGPQAAVEVENVPITQQETPPPPENIREPVVSDVLQIVNNDIKVASTILTTEDVKGVGVDIKDYVVTQAAPEEASDNEVIPFAIVEEKPKFQGGDQNDFTKWVFGHIEYPEIAKENGVQGRVTLQFTVDTDGSVKNVSVLRGVDASLDKEAVRVVSSSPKWTPGRQRNKNVKVRYTFPVIFQLK